MQPQVNRCTAADWHFPLGRPTGHHASPRWPRPWQWAEIWDRSSPTLRSPPECQPLPLIINAWSFPFTPFFLVDALYPPSADSHLLLLPIPSLRRAFPRHCHNWTSTRPRPNLLPSNGYAVYDRYCCFALPPRSGLNTSDSGYSTE